MNGFLEYTHLFCACQEGIFWDLENRIWDLVCKCKLKIANWWRLGEAVRGMTPEPQIDTDYTDCSDFVGVETTPTTG
jgi:hypothetical protein